MRVVCCLLLLLASQSALAEGFISRLLNHPVPGGVAVVALGSEAQAPTARYQGKPVLVVREEGKRWIAIVGIPLKSQPGPHQLQVSDGRTLGFTVGTKHYREQHIKLKNSRQVNPLAEDMTRINRELAEQTRAYQTFSPTQPSNLLFDKPVEGPLSSPFGLSRWTVTWPHQHLDGVSANGLSCHCSTPLSGGEGSAQGHRRAGSAGRPVPPPSRRRREKGVTRSGAGGICLTTPARPAPAPSSRCG